MSSVPPSAAVTDKRVRTEKAQRNTNVARLSTLKSVTTIGSILWVDSAELRWTHDKIQRLFTCGRRLEDVVTDFRRDILLPSDLRMIKIAPWESKWYSRNNRWLCCFRKAAVFAVQVRVGSTDRAFLHGLTTRTDGLSVVFFPPSACKACGEEFVNVTKLHNHNCWSARTCCAVSPEFSEK